MLSPSYFFASQARHPKGIFGKFIMSRLFNQGNVRLNALIRENLGIRGDEQALEIGFGTGRLLNSVAKELTSGTLRGIDFSEAMHGLAEKTNQPLIAKGKVCLKQGDFNTAPYLPDSFDLVFSVNTLYFWEFPEKTLERIHSVLRPGGRLVLGFHAPEVTGKMDSRIFRNYTAPEVKALLEGRFDRVEILSGREQIRTTYCAVAGKK